jgi:KipI family sensor histidine kinase inhibitor
MSVPVRPAGDRAVLIELADGDAALGVAAAIRARLGAQVEDVVVGHRTVLVSWPQDAAMPSVDWAALARSPAPVAAAAGDEIELDVRYDGPDLGEVAALTGMGVDEVVARHSAARYRVGFIGFAPGFAYLVGGDPALAVPRRAEPRPRVAPGTVAVAGPYTTVYPTASPGGWRLIGTVAATIFDPCREPPALLAPGARVRLRPR